MNDRRSRYNESSGKNKALTAQIKEAELILQQLEQDLEAEQGTLRQLKAADAEWQGHQETVRSYCELLDTVRAAPPSLLLETTRISPGAADEEGSTPGAIGGGSSRRFDISEQLMDPVTLLCHKMERLWAKQMDMLMDPMTPTERQAHRNFETEIQQLLTKQHSHQFLTSVQSLLDHELERLERLAMDMGAPLPATTTPQDRENNNDKENAPQFIENAMEDKENAPPTLMPSPSPPPATRAAPSASALAVEEGSELMFRKCADEICQQQKILLKNALELEEQGTQWEQRLQDLERQAFERILKLYENSDIQEAHLSYVIANVASTTVRTTTTAMGKYDDQIAHKIKQMQEDAQLLPNRSPVFPEIIQDIVDIQTKIKAIKVTNAAAWEEIESRRNEIAGLAPETQDLMARVRQLFSSDQQHSKHKSMASRSPSPDAPMDHLRQALSCGTATPDDRVMTRIRALLDRYTIMNNKPADQQNIGSDMESLVLAWTEELADKGCEIPPAKTHEDAIDGLMHVVKALEDYVDRTWVKRVRTQQRFLADKMDELDREKEVIQQLETVMDERNAIIEGKLASDYTIADRTLEEWFQLLNQAEPKTQSQ